MFNMTNSLTLDLLQTAMEDFVEHFERTMERHPHEIVYGLRRPGAGVFDDVAFELLQPGLQSELLEGHMILVDINRFIEGNTRRVYRVTVEQRIEFRLTVERFRRDRLRLVLEEYFGPFRHAQRLVQWLTYRWGEPVFLPNFEGLSIRRNPPVEIGLTTVETWVAELTAIGVEDHLVAGQFLLSKQAVERHRRSISKKAKAYKQIDRDLKPGEFSELLRELGYGTGTLP